MSCLFQSLSKGIPNTTSEQLRRESVRYLEDNGPLFDDDLGSRDIIGSFDDFKKYVREMKKPSTWGGAIEIRAIVELHVVNVCIHLKHSDHRIMIKPLTEKSSDTIHVSYNGSHYMFIKKNINVY